MAVRGDRDDPFSRGFIILTDDRGYDEASGTAVLFGTPVTVEPIASIASKEVLPCQSSS